MKYFSDEIQKITIMETHENSSVSELQSAIKSNRFDIEISSTYDDFYNKILNELLEKRIKERDEHIDFLENTLIPDLYESDPDSPMGKDFELCIK